MTSIDHLTTLLDDMELTETEVSSITNFFQSAQALARSSYKAPKPTLFSGGRNALATRDWLQELERYCRHTALPTFEWTSAAVDHLRGPASTWFQTTKMTDKTPWADFKTAFLAEFRPSDHQRSILMELRNLKQPSVKDMTTYVNRFRDLALQLDKPADEMLREYFIEGLTLQTRVQVEIANPSTWSDAIRTAERINGVFARAQQHQRHTYIPTTATANHAAPVTTTAAPTTVPSYLDGAGEPMDIDNIRFRNTNRRPLGRLTDAEREELRRIGACFRCRRTGHRATDCRSAPAQGRRLNSVEVNAGDDDSGKAEGGQ